MPTEFEVRGNKYVTGRMDAMTQFHVICKFGPAMRVAAERGATALLETFAALSDQDREFVIIKCLSTVQRQTGDSWQTVWNKQANRPQFEDLMALDLMDISAQVMEESFRDFFPESPSGSTGEEPQSVE